MSNWKLYLRDYAPEATSYTFGAGIGNGANIVSGYDSNVASVASGATSTIDFTLPTSVACGAVGIANHNLTGATVYLYSGFGTSLIGASRVIASNDDTILDTGSYASGTTFRVKISGVAGKCGCISLLSSDHVITITNAWPVHPLQNSLNAYIGEQRTVTGQKIEQRRGGASQTWGLTIPLVKTTDTTTGQEGKIDEMWTDEAWGVQGFLGPIWLVDDNVSSPFTTVIRRAYHGHVIRPMPMPITHAGGMATVELTFETIPHMGLM
jgi:hypothetical protein